MDPIILSCKMPAQQVYGRIRNIFVESHKNDSFWRFQKDRQEEGQMIVVLQWSEYFGENLRDQERMVRVEVEVTPLGNFEEMYSTVTLRFDVRSPIHRGQVNQVVETVLKDIREHTNAMN